ncbi:MFS transporter [Actinocrinis puniceicyclus]|uniref:MFS transporter n=1 Tax=Actinocrinis puniceicyclus TaxID=977794 RepID=A0A8J7WIV8_9ACTN|nr:MFS transporter [Actinocrinis puniceicyclus]MBS2962133.1 MFS transporter [Actinocrinis puniceicyclus]
MALTAPPDGSGDSSSSTRTGTLPRVLRTLLTGPHLHSFRLLFATRIVGQLSDGTFQVALASYVIFSPEKQATAGQVAEAFAVLLLPFTVVGPFAGVFLDRWPRRQVLVRANLLRAALVVVVAVLVALHVPNVVFYIGALGVLSANRFILAGLSASLPHTVPSRHLVAANSALPTAGTLAATAGGAVSLIVHALLGSGDNATIGELACVAALYTAAAMCAVGIARTALGPDQQPEESTWSAVRTVAVGVAQGARHLAARPVAGRALLAVTVSRFCYGVVTIMTLLLYRNYFNNPDQPASGLAGFALAVGLSGAGFGLSALITPLATRRLRLETWITVCLLAAAVTELCFGLPFRPVPLLAGALLLGLASQGQKICTDTLAQRSVDDEYRGRVFVFYDMVFNGAFVLAAAFSAAALPANGKSYVVVTIVAACYALVGLWYGLGATLAAFRVPRRRPDAPVEPPTTPAVR